MPLHEPDDENIQRELLNFAFMAYTEKKPYGHRGQYLIDLKYFLREHFKGRGDESPQLERLFEAIEASENLAKTLRQPIKAGVAQMPPKEKSVDKVQKDLLVAFKEFCATRDIYFPIEDQKALDFYIYTKIQDMANGYEPETRLWDLSDAEQIFPAAKSQSFQEFRRSWDPLLSYQMFLHDTSEGQYTPENHQNHIDDLIEWAQKWLKENASQTKSLPRENPIA